MKTLQLIGITPEQLQEEIIKGVKVQLDELKRDFQPKTPTEWLTRDEVSKLLKIDLSTVHNWCKRGKLQPWGIGNRVYFKRSQVEAAIKPLND
jgi:excisionase family DNA binding protein